MDWLNIWPGLCFFRSCVPFVWVKFSFSWRWWFYDLWSDGEVEEDPGPDLLQFDAIDDGVDERRHHQELCRQRIVQRLQRAAAAVAGVHGVKDQGEGEHQQGDEVRQTRLNELHAARPRADRGADQVCVGDQDESCLSDVREGEHQAVDVVDGGVGAGQLHHLPVGAEDFRDVAVAEGQSGGEAEAHHRLQQREAPGEQQQLRHPLRRHQRVVLERLTDGQVAVIGHDGQAGELTEHIVVHHEQLRHAARVRDDVGFGQEVVEQLRVEAGRSADPVHTQVTQEHVNGLVQCLV